ncbi:MAG: hypothetical protein IKC32_01695 [Clostridia bacterium]|nr:hypothetical protein [Clostridia bacterium]
MAIFTNNWKNAENERRGYDEALICLPPEMRGEIEEISRSNPGLVRSLGEIRLRVGARCELVADGYSYPLFYRMSAEDVAFVMDRLTDGALYPHRETLARGYISRGALRAGISGRVRYDKGSVGLGDISSIVLRLGGGSCSFGEELYRKYVERGAPDLLIAAPPMGGKTTALRSLVGYIGGGRSPRRTVVVDERCEFDPCEYSSASVDVLSGYQRTAGIEQAYRTMSAQVIVVDEIATVEEAEALRSATGAGVGLINSVHAGSPADALGRECIAPLVRDGVYSAVAFIERRGREYSFIWEDIG